MAQITNLGQDNIFYNCPRYIPKMEFVHESVYSPQCDYTPPQPEWKIRDYIRDVLKDEDGEF